MTNCDKYIQTSQITSVGHQKCNLHTSSLLEFVIFEVVLLVAIAGSLFALQNDI